MGRLACLCYVWSLPAHQIARRSDTDLAEVLLRTPSLLDCNTCQVMREYICSSPHLDSERYAMGIVGTKFEIRMPSSKVPRQRDEAYLCDGARALLDTTGLKRWW